jgi:hypothetical protein
LPELPRLPLGKDFCEQDPRIAGHLLIESRRFDLNICNSHEWVSLPIETVRPYGRQVRRHDRRKIAKLKKLTRHFGQGAPIIIDANQVIIDGHAVWQAAQVRRSLLLRKPDATASAPSWIRSMSTSPFVAGKSTPAAMPSTLAPVSCFANVPNVWPPEIMRPGHD